MRTEFTAVPPTAGRSEVLDLMRARTLNQIPIVDEAGRLVGLHLLREIIGAERRPNWAVIMAGGRGERLRPLTDALPKPMVRVAGRPILERIVLHLVGSGIRRIFLSVNYLAQVIEEHFGDGAAYGCRIEYLRETQPLGTGGSLGLLPERPHGSPAGAQRRPGHAVRRGEHARLPCARRLRGHRGRPRVRPRRALRGARHGRGTRHADLRETRSLAGPTNAGIYVLDPGDARAQSRRIRRTRLPACWKTAWSGAKPWGRFFIEDDWLDVGRQQELRQARGLEQ